MSNINIKRVVEYIEIPYELLYLADPSKESINDYISRGDLYVAYIENEVVGAYVILKTRSLTTEIMNISVKEAYQQKGIGKVLIEHAISTSKNLNIKTLEVGTGNSSIYQLAFYQKCGFRIVGVDKDFFKKHYDEKIIENGIECVDMIRMSMDL
ncbi:GNAT family N-acetyltransferase [Paraclostridium bifermentans]|uniref:GNAT family N-acetyltransferase n=1 Tax=Paraclostridium bifermentans TaxID=1490 RepID=UPI001FF493FA|nr:GNAT family N-acetyltransferase [Paraclostridium bifermentans]UOW69154.1 GNAT family N-acetyltransferase [Paraclostridium bifermentans]